MHPLLATLRSRLLPALITALGVVIMTAGLMSYGDPATAGTAVEESPTIEVLSPTPAPTASPTVSPTASPTTAPSPSATAVASPAARVLATRVVVPALDIDLPIVKGNNGYPLCNVAMYLTELGQPGEARATYLYAHARDGMFGPIYELAIQRKQGRKMLGMIVQVYTSDDRLHLYEIREVRLHQTDLDDALAATTDQLWLQTSEGPKGTPGKTQLIAYPVSVGDADPADARPKPKPVRCG
jgi:sortase (surface protein transpeptidase)